jgi:L-arabinose isomerase
MRKARIGLYSAGLRAYWDQFAGLRERLMGYNAFIEKRLSKFGEVHNFGIVDTPDAARAAGEFMNAHSVDIIFLHSATYFTSSCVLPVSQFCKSPVVVLNLQPAPRMNYDLTGTGEWLAQCVGCAVPEAANAFERANIPFRCVNGLLGLDETPADAAADEKTGGMDSAVCAWREIEAWSRAAGVKAALQSARFGFLGGNYTGMLDMYSDFTLLSAKLGIHVELLEMCDLAARLDGVTDAEASSLRQKMAEFFEISGDSPSDPIARKPTEAQLDWSARVAAAQKKLADDFSLDALSYYYHGADGNEYERIQGGFIVGHSLLTAEGIPCAGEGDMKTCAAMKISDLLGVGGSFSEIVAMDYLSNTMLLGHDGPFHIKIAEGKPMLRGMGVYHGKRGSGVSVEARVKRGPVTTLGITQTRGGGLRMIASEGEALNLPILKIGNTQTHVDFGMDLDKYMDQWFKLAPTHHYAISVGHNAALFEKVADLMGIEFCRVGPKREG